MKITGGTDNVKTYSDLPVKCWDCGNVTMENNWVADTRKMKVRLCDRCYKRRTKHLTQ